MSKFKKQRDFARRITESLVSGHGEFNKEPDKFGNSKGGMFELGFRSIIEDNLLDLGYDVSSDNFLKSAVRAAKGYRELIWPKKSVAKEVNRILKVEFPTDISGISNDYKGMIALKGVTVHGLCPHHFMLWEGKVDVAYIPGKGKRLLGLSKLARLAVVLSKQPILQESYTQLVAAALFHILGAEGSACVVRGSHGCMCSRGPKTVNTSLTTASYFGAFFKNLSTRSEFMNYS